MGVHGIVEDMNKLQTGELPEEELRALEVDLTGKVQFLLSVPDVCTLFNLICPRTDFACFMAWHALRDHTDPTGSGG